MSKLPLEKAIEIAGSQTALGKLIGRDQRTVWWWLNKTNPKGRVPPEVAITIEEGLSALGGEVVTRQALRPDIFIQ